MLHYEEDCQLGFGNDQGTRDDPLFGNTSNLLYPPQSSG